MVGKVAIYGLRMSSPKVCRIAAVKAGEKLRAALGWVVGAVVIVIFIAVYFGEETIKQTLIALAAWAGAWVIVSESRTTKDLIRTSDSGEKPVRDVSGQSRVVSRRACPRGLGAGRVPRLRDGRRDVAGEAGRGRRVSVTGAPSR